jgi:hypothetical protein
MPSRDGGVPKLFSLRINALASQGSLERKSPEDGVSLPSLCGQLMTAGPELAPRTWIKGGQGTRPSALPTRS